MLIRMTPIGTHIAAVLGAGVLVAGAALAADASTGDEGVRDALVVDASLARDGRQLVDPRLRDVDAEVRLPRDADEARTNVAYFDALGYRVYVSGPDATAAAKSTEVNATEVDDLTDAVDATR
jgi:hypothetical protein